METLASRTAQAKAALRLAAPRIVLAMAQTGLALVVLRVQRDGVGVTYSTRLVSTGWFADRVLNSAGTAYIAANKRGTWGQFRAAQGLPGVQVNLTYTGATIRSLTPTAGSSNGPVSTAVLVASNAESAKVLAYTLLRYPGWLDPNAAEQAQVAAVGKVELDKVINQFLGPK